LSLLGKEQEWMPHTSTKQRKRQMRQTAHPIVKSKDARVVRACQMLRDATYEGHTDPYHEFFPVVCALLYESRKHAEGWGHDWEVCKNHWVNAVHKLLHEVDETGGENP